MAAQHPFELDHDDHPGYDLVTLRGDLDVRTAPRLRRLTRESDHLSRPLLVLDLTAMDFLDSSGIGALVGTQRDSHADHVTLALVLRSTSSGMKLLRMMRLDEYFTIYATVDSAVDDLAS